MPYAQERQCEGEGTQVRWCKGNSDGTDGCCDGGIRGARSVAGACAAGGGGGMRSRWSGVAEGSPMTENSPKSPLISSETPCAVPRGVCDSSTMSGICTQHAGIA